MVGVVWAQLWPQWEKNNVHHSGGDQQAGSCQASGGLKMGPSQTMLGIRLLFKGKVIREFWPLFLSWFEPIYATDKQAKVFSNYFSTSPAVCMMQSVSTLWSNISAKPKPNSKILSSVYQRPGWFWIMKKMQVEISWHTHFKKGLSQDFGRFTWTVKLLSWSCFLCLSKVHSNFFC